MYPGVFFVFELQIISPSCALKLLSGIAQRLVRLTADQLIPFRVPLCLTCVGLVKRD